MTALSQAIDAATDTLLQAGVESPEHDARALALHVLGLERPSDLLMVDDIDADAYEALVLQRAKRVPLQHLTGKVGFRWLDLEVGPGVFIPRPETESVVQWAVDNTARAPLVVDLCTGSGVIALSLAHEVDGAVVHAVESDPDALAWARRNADARQAAGDPEVTLHLASVQAALPELDGTVDLVVANPPYVPESLRGMLHPEVHHDPELALFAGPDGLEVVREVEATARRLLRPGGQVVVEHDDTQGVTALEVFADWDEVTGHRDLTGRDRFLTARFPA